MTCLSLACLQTPQVWGCDGVEDIGRYGSREDIAFALRIEVEQAEEIIRHKVERIMHLSDEIIKEANDSESELLLPKNSTDADIFNEAVVYITDEADIIKSICYTLRLITVNISHEVQNWTDRISNGLTLGGGGLSVPCESDTTNVVPSQERSVQAGPVR